MRVVLSCSGANDSILALRHQVAQGQKLAVRSEHCAALVLIVQEAGRS